MTQGILSTFRRQTWIKGLALATGFTFLIPSLSWAFESARYQSPGAVTPVWASGKSLAVPANLGVIQQASQGQEKTIVCIQDLHCNYEVQKNIAALIGYLADHHGLRLVGVEGAFGELHTEKIRLFPDARMRAGVCDYFVKQGKLTGAEWYAANARQPVLLVGIENEELYQASRVKIDAFLNAESQGYCLDLREQLDQLKSGLYSRSLLAFDHRRTAYRQGDLDVLAYAAHLDTTAHHLRVPVGDLPQIRTFLDLRQPVVSEKIDPDRLFTELDALDRRIRERLYVREDQRELDHLLARLDVLERLLNISATPGEVREFQEHPELFRTSVFQTFLRRQGVGTDWDADLARLDAYLRPVREFYQLADRRSVAFVDRILREMDGAGENLAVMINGGFHTAAILEELRRRNLTYVSLQPRVTRHDVVNPYFSLLQNRKTPLEQLLAKNQILFALRTWLNNPEFWSEAELVLKPLLLADNNPAVRSHADAFMQANAMTQVVPMTSGQVGLDPDSEFDAFTTSVRNSNGVPLAILVGTAGSLPEPARSRVAPIDSKTILNRTIQIYPSVEELAHAAKSVKRVRMWAAGLNRLLRSAISALRNAQMKSYPSIFGFLVRLLQKQPGLVAALPVVLLGLVAGVLPADAMQTLIPAVGWLAAGLLMITLLLPGRGGMASTVVEALSVMLAQPNPPAPKRVTHPYEMKGEHTSGTPDRKGGKAERAKRSGNAPVDRKGLIEEIDKEMRGLSRETMILGDNTDSPLLMFHGFTSSPRDLYPTMRLLAEDHRIIMPLLPRHQGDREALREASAQEWLDFALRTYDAWHARYPNLAVGGHSMGAVLAAWVAARRPKQVPWVVQIAPGFELQFQETSRLIAELIKYNPMVRWFNEFIHGDDGLWIENHLHDVAEELFGNQLLEKIHVKNIAEVLEVAEKGKEALPRIQAPILLIGSENDSVLPTDILEKVKRWATGSSRLVTASFNQSRHMMTMDTQFVEIAEAIRRFIRNAQEETERSEKQKHVIELAWERYIKNGWMYHGTKRRVLDSVRRNGLDTRYRPYQADVMAFYSFYEKIMGPSETEQKNLRNSTTIHVTASYEHALERARRPPEVLDIMLGQIDELTSAYARASADSKPFPAKAYRWLLELKNKYAPWLDNDAVVLAVPLPVAAREALARQEPDYQDQLANYKLGELSAEQLYARNDLYAFQDAKLFACYLRDVFTDIDSLDEPGLLAWLGQSIPEVLGNDLHDIAVRKIAPEHLSRVVENGILEPLDDRSPVSAAMPWLKKIFAHFGLPEDYYNVIVAWWLENILAQQSAALIWTAIVGTGWLFGVTPPEGALVYASWGMFFGFHGLQMLWGDRAPPRRTILATGFISVAGIVLQAAPWSMLGLSIHAVINIAGTLAVRDRARILADHVQQTIKRFVFLPLLPESSPALSAGTLRLFLSLLPEGMPYSVRYAGNERWRLDIHGTRRSWGRDRQYVTFKQQSAGGVYWHDIGLDTAWPKKVEAKRLAQIEFLKFITEKAKHAMDGREHHVSKALLLGPGRSLVEALALLEQFPSIEELVLVDYSDVNLFHLMAEWSRVPERTRRILRIEHAEFLDNGLPAAYFDLMYSRDVIRGDMFYQRLPEAWREVRRLLKAGGYFAGLAFAPEADNQSVTQIGFHVVYQADAYTPWLVLRNPAEDVADQRMNKRGRHRVPTATFPWLKTLFIQIGWPDDDYGVVVAWWLENYLAQQSAALAWTAIVGAGWLFGVTPPEGALLYLSWGAFYGLHFLQMLWGDRGPPRGNRMAAGLIAAAGIFLQVTPFSFLGLAIHLAANNLAPLVKTMFDQKRIQAFIQAIQRGIPTQPGLVAALPTVFFGLLAGYLPQEAWQTGAPALGWLAAGLLIITTLLPGRGGMAMALAEAVRISDSHETDPSPVMHMRSEMSGEQASADTVAMIAELEQDRERKRTANLERLEKVPEQISDAYLRETGVYHRYGKGRRSALPRGKGLYGVSATVDIPVEGALAEGLDLLKSRISRVASLAGKIKFYDEFSEDGLAGDRHGLHHIFKGYRVHQEESISDTEFRNYEIACRTSVRNGNQFRLGLDGFSWHSNNEKLCVRASASEGYAQTSRAFGKDVYPRIDIACAVIVEALTPEETAALKGIVRELFDHSMGERRVDTVTLHRHDNDVLLGSEKVQLGLGKTADKKLTAQAAIALAWERYVKNGWMYHGTKRRLLPHVLQHGLNIRFRPYQNDVMAFSTFYRKVVGLTENDEKSYQNAKTIHITASRSHADDQARRPPEIIHIMLRQVDELLTRYDETDGLAKPFSVTARNWLMELKANYSPWLTDDAMVLAVPLVDALEGALAYQVPDYRTWMKKYQQGENSRDDLLARSALFAFQDPSLFALYVERLGRAAGARREEDVLAWLETELHDVLERDLYDVALLRMSAGDLHVVKENGTYAPLEKGVEEPMVPVEPEAGEGRFTDSELMEHLQTEMIRRGREHLVRYANRDALVFHREMTSTGLEMVVVEKEFDAEMAYQQFQEFYLAGKKLVGYGDSFLHAGSTLMLWHIFPEERGRVQKNAQKRSRLLFLERIRVLQRLTGDAIRNIQIPPDQIKYEESEGTGAVVFYMKLGFKPRTIELVPLYQQCLEKMKRSEQILPEEIKALSRSEYILENPSRLLAEERPETKQPPRRRFWEKTAPSGSMLWLKSVFVRFGLPNEFYGVFVAWWLENYLAQQSAALAWTAIVGAGWLFGVTPPAGTLLYLSWGAFYGLHFLQMLWGDRAPPTKRDGIFAALITGVGILMGVQPFSCGGMAVHLLANLPGFLLPLDHLGLGLMRAWQRLVAGLAAWATVRSGGGVVTRGKGIQPPSLQEHPKPVGPTKERSVGKSPTGRTAMEDSDASNRALFPAGQEPRTLRERENSPQQEDLPDQQGRLGRFSIDFETMQRTRDLTLDDDLEIPEETKEKIMELRDRVTETKPQDMVGEILSRPDYYYILFDWDRLTDAKKRMIVRAAKQPLPETTQLIQQVRMTLQNLPADDTINLLTRRLRALGFVRMPSFRSPEILIYENDGGWTIKITHAPEYPSSRMEFRVEKKAIPSNKVAFKIDERGCPLPNRKSAVRPIYPKWSREEALYLNAIMKRVHFYEPAVHLEEVLGKTDYAGEWHMRAKAVMPWVREIFIQLGVSMAWYDLALAWIVENGLAQGLILAAIGGAGWFFGVTPPEGALVYAAWATFFGLHFLKTPWAERAPPMHIFSAFFVAGVGMGLGVAPFSMFGLLLHAGVNLITSLIWPRSPARDSVEPRRVLVTPGEPIRVSDEELDHIGPNDTQKTPKRLSPRTPVYGRVLDALLPGNDLGEWAVMRWIMFGIIPGTYFVHLLTDLKQMRGRSARAQIQRIAELFLAVGAFIPFLFVYAFLSPILLLALFLDLAMRAGLLPNTATRRAAWGKLSGWKTLFWRWGVTATHPTEDRHDALRTERLILRTNYPWLTYLHPLVISALARIYRLGHAAEADRYQVDVIHHDGRPAYRLVDRHAGSEMVIVPGDANRLVSWTFGSKTLFQANEVMAPFIDRLKGNHYTFEGTTRSLDDQNLIESGYTKKLDDGTVFHGMAHSQPWLLQRIGYNREGLYLKSSFMYRLHAAVREAFGNGRADVTYRLSGNTLENIIELDNRTLASTGSHNFVLRKPGDRWHVRIPARQTLREQNMIPTGERDPVINTYQDLREFTPLRQDRHVIYDGLVRDADGLARSYAYNAADGTLIVIEQDEALPFIVLWDAFDDCFAIEPVSSPPDALNDENGERQLHPIRSRHFQARVNYRAFQLKQYNGKPYTVADVPEIIAGLFKQSAPKGEEKLKFEEHAPQIIVFPEDARGALVANAEGFEKNGKSRVDFNRTLNYQTLDGKQVPFKETGTFFGQVRLGIQQIIKTYKKTRPEQEILAILPNGNLGFNDWFIGYARGRVYFNPREKLDQRTYDVLAERFDGTQAVMSVKLVDKQGRQGIYTENDQDLSSEVSSGIYGQRIVKNGKVNLEAVYDQFEDLRHLLRFPMFHLPQMNQLHLGFSDGIGEMLQNRRMVLDAIQGKPVTLSQKPLWQHQITPEKRDAVFSLWGYGNVTGQKAITDLIPGEYLVDRKTDTLTMCFLPGIHPHSFFGLHHDGRLLAGVVPGVTHVAGISLAVLAEELIKQGAWDVFLWGNGKDAYLWQNDQTVIRAEGARGDGLSALLISRKQSNKAFTIGLLVVAGLLALTGQGWAVEQPMFASDAPAMIGSPARQTTSAVRKVILGSVVGWASLAWGGDLGVGSSASPVLLLVMILGLMMVAYTKNLLEKGSTRSLALDNIRLDFITWVEGFLRSLSESGSALRRRIVRLAQDPRWWMLLAFLVLPAAGAWGMNAPGAFTDVLPDGRVIRLASLASAVLALTGIWMLEPTMDRRDSPEPIGRVVIDRLAVDIYRHGSYYPFEYLPINAGERVGFGLNYYGWGGKHDDDSGVPDIFIYHQLDLNQGKQPGLKGIRIGDVVRGEGLMRFVLNLFFVTFPHVRRTHTDVKNMLLLRTLIQDYGFGPEREMAPNVWIQQRPSDGTNEAVVRACFADPTQREDFESINTPLGIQKQVEVVSSKDDSFAPLYYRVPLIVTDEKKFRAALARTPIEVLAPYPPGGRNGRGVWPLASAMWQRVGGRPDIYVRWVAPWLENGLSAAVFGLGVGLLAHMAGVREPALLLGLGNVVTWLGFFGMHYVKGIDKTVATAADKIAAAKIAAFNMAAGTVVSLLAGWFSLFALSPLALPIAGGVIFAISVIHHAMINPELPTAVTPDKRSKQTSAKSRKTGKQKATMKKQPSPRTRVSGKSKHTESSLPTRWLAILLAVSAISALGILATNWIKSEIFKQPLTEQKRPDEGQTLSLEQMETLLQQRRFVPDRSYLEKYEKSEVLFKNDKPSFLTNYVKEQERIFVVVTGSHGSREARQLISEVIRDISDNTSWSLWLEAMRPGEPAPAYEYQNVLELAERNQLPIIDPVISFGNPLTMRKVMQNIPELTKEEMAAAIILKTVQDMQIKDAQKITNRIRNLASALGLDVSALMDAINQLADLEHTNPKEYARKRNLMKQAQDELVVVADELTAGFVNYLLQHDTKKNILMVIGKGHYSRIHKVLITQGYQSLPERKGSPIEKGTGYPKGGISEAGRRAFASALNVILRGRVSRDRLDAFYSRHADWIESLFFGLIAGLTYWQTGGLSWTVAAFWGPFELGHYMGPETPRDNRIAAGILTIFNLAAALVLVQLTSWPVLTILIILAGLALVSHVGLNRARGEMNGDLANVVEALEGQGEQEEKSIRTMAARGASPKALFEAIMHKEDYYRYLFNWKSLKPAARERIQQYAEGNPDGIGTSARTLPARLLRLLSSTHAEDRLDLAHRVLTGEWGFRRVRTILGDPNRVFYEHDDGTVVQLRFNSRWGWPLSASRIEFSVGVKIDPEKSPQKRNQAFKVDLEGKPYPKSLQDTRRYFPASRPEQRLAYEKRVFDPTRFVYPRYDISFDNGWGAWPILLSFWNASGGSERTYASRVAPWLENGVSASFFGLGFGLVAQVLGVQDPALLLGLGNVATWVGFLGMHFIPARSRAASAADKAAAGRIAFFNIVLGTTVAALGWWFSLFALSPCILSALALALFAVSTFYHLRTNLTQPHMPGPIDVTRLRAFQTIAAKDAYRARHILRVIGYGDAFFAGNFEYFLDRLPDTRSTEDRANYRMHVEELRRNLMKLPVWQQNALRWAYYLHDLGLAEEPARGHEGRGAILARSIMQERGVDENIIDLTTKIIGHHTALGWVRLGEYTPASYRHLIEIPLLFYQIHNLLDVSGVGDPFSILSLEQLTEIVDYETNESWLKQNYDVYRLNKLAKSFYGAPDLSTGEQERLQNTVTEIFGKHNEALREILRNRVDLRQIFVFLMHALSAKDHSFRLFAKFMKFIALLASLRGLDNEVLTGDLEELFPEFGREEAPRRAAERIAEMMRDWPDDMDEAFVRDYVRQADWIDVPNDPGQPIFLSIVTLLGKGKERDRVESVSRREAALEKLIKEQVEHHDSTGVSVLERQGHNVVRLMLRALTLSTYNPEISVVREAILKEFPLKQSRDLNAYHDALLTLIRFGRSYQTDPAARHYVLQAARLKALRDLPDLRESTDTLFHPDMKAGSEYWDLGAGTNFAWFMKNLQPDIVYRVFDQSPFVCEYLRHVAGSMGLNHVRVEERNIQEIERPAGGSGPTVIRCANLLAKVEGLTESLLEMAQWLTPDGMLLIQNMAVYGQRAAMRTNLAPAAELLLRQGWFFHYSLGSDRYRMDTLIFSRAASLRRSRWQNYLHETARVMEGKPADTAEIVKPGTTRDPLQNVPGWRAGQDRALMNSIQRQMTARERGHMVEWAQPESLPVFHDVLPNGLEHVVIRTALDEGIGAQNFLGVFLDKGKLIAYGHVLLHEHVAQMGWYIFPEERQRGNEVLKSRNERMFHARIRFWHELAGGLREVVVPADQFARPEAFESGTVANYMRYGFRPRWQALQSDYQKALKRLKQGEKLDPREIARLSGSDWVLEDPAGWLERNRSKFENLKLPFNEPLSRRSRWLDRAPGLLRRVAIMTLGLSLMLLSRPSAGEISLSLNAINQHPAMVEFKQRHGLTSAAAMMKEKPQNIHLREAGRMEFLTGFRSFFRLWRGEREVTVTPALLRRLDLDTLNQDARGWRGFIQTWFTRAGLARQVLIVNLEHQTRLYDRLTKWRARLARWGWLPLDRVLLYEEQDETTPVPTDRPTYAAHTRGKNYRNVSPVDFGRLVQELVADVNATLAPGEQIEGVRSTLNEVREEKQNLEKFLSMRDGHEKALHWLETKPNTLWAVLLKEVRGRPEEALVAAGVLEDVLYSDHASSLAPGRPMAIAPDVSHIRMLASPAMSAYLRDLLDNMNEVPVPALQARRDFLRKVIESLSRSDRTGQVIELGLTEAETRLLAGEVDRLHENDASRAALLGSEDNEAVYTVCTAGRKVMKFGSSRKTHEFLAPSLGEFLVGLKPKTERQNEDLTARAKEDSAAVVERLRAGTLRWSEFRGRPSTLRAEGTAVSSLENMWATVILAAFRILGSRGRRLLGPRILGLSSKAQTLYLDQLTKKVEENLDKDLNLENAGFATGQMALLRIELQRKNSHLRNLFRRMLERPGDIRRQADFARALVRFLIKLEEYWQSHPPDGDWSERDRLRMNILAVSALTELIDILPIINDFAMPEDGQEQIENKRTKKRTKPMKNISILGILLPESLNIEQKNNLGIKGTTGSLVDLLERHHFRIDENTRNTYFRRTFRLRMGGSA